MFKGCSVFKVGSVATLLVNCMAGNCSSHLQNELEKGLEETKTTRLEYEKAIKLAEENKVLRSACELAASEITTLKAYVAALRSMHQTYIEATEERFSAITNKHEKEIGECLKRVNEFDTAIKLLTERIDQLRNSIDILSVDNRKLRAMLLQSDAVTDTQCK